MKGLIIVYTGNGKGKTTAGYGSAFRAAGHNLKVKIIQFIKDDKILTGENKAAKSLGIEVEVFGKGFVGILNDKLPLGEHKKAAQAALESFIDAISSRKYSMVVADEILGAVYGKLISEEKVILALRDKSEKTTAILTGRNASEKIIQIADTVTEMKEIKHHWTKNISVQKGIEF